jgi:predicted N-formylglutamate amidohydrolase
VHSFTPVLDGVVRRTDVGVLYDPRRPGERDLALELRRRLRAAHDWRVRLNDPYRGNADGLTTTLRRRFPENRYWGIELEVNQRLVKRSPARWFRLQQTLAKVLCELPVTILA